MKLALLSPLFILLSLFATLPSFAQIQVKQRYLGIFELQDQTESKGVDANGDPTRPYRRRTIDLREIEAEVELVIDPKSKFEFEVDYEHGGTGSAVEYDQHEEFGEFERETEKGGEVEVEEAYYLRKLTPSTDLIIGKAPLYISLTSILDSYPLLYPSAQTSYLEARMIPYKWREIGAQVHQRLGDWTLRLATVTGLNSETFRSDAWIGSGQQRMFERINADDLALVTGVEWGDVAQGRGIGLAYYYSETTNNRYKRDRFTDPGKINLWSAMGQWSFGPLGLMGEVIRGTLQNSDKISEANANYPASEPVASSAPSLGARAILDVLQVRWDINEQWSVFGQWEHVNTFQQTAGNIVAMPRFDVHHEGAGFSYRFDEYFFTKFHYYTEKTALKSIPASNVYTVQFGFDTGEF